MSEESSGPDEAVLNILEQCILAREQGEAVDLDALCGGDADLLERIERLLASEPASMRRLSSREVAAMQGAPRVAEKLEIEQLGDYLLLEQIGSGGMGTVYLAQQSALGRKVALKVLHPTALHDERARARFHREAEIAAALDHPHIVPIYGIGEDKGCSFIAMKLLTGPGLDAVEKPVDPREAARIGAAAARALDQAHLSGVVHRDIKPANVILDHDEPCIVDFGLARAQTDVTLTRAGTVPGTLAYLAPELLRGGAGLDPRSDVYALGATLYELLSGRAPFEGATPEEFVSRILLEEPRPLRLPRDDRDLETIVLRALEKEPERRFASALEMAEDIERYLAGEPIVSRPSSLFDRAWKLSRRHRTASMLLGGSALVALILAGLLSWKVLDARREFDRNVGAVREALARRDWTEAGILLARLVDSSGGDASVADLAARLKAERAYEALLDAVVNRPAGLRTDELELTVTNARESGALTLHPRTGKLAIATASFLLGHPERARDELREFRAVGGASSAADSLAALLDGARETPMPEEALDIDPDERILIGLAQYLAGAGNAGLRRESEIVLRRDPTHRRARYVLAIALAEAGQLSEAERILQGLILPHPTPRELWRNLSRIQLDAGKLWDARESLKQIREEDWTPVVAYQYLELLKQEARFDEFERELEKSRQRFGDALFLRSAAAYRGTVQQRYDEALELADRAVAAESDPMYRDICVAMRFLLQCDALQSTSSPEFLIPEDERARYEALLERGGRLGSELRYPRARETVAWMLGRHLLRLGRVAEGVEQLDRAIDLLPWEIGPQFDYVVGLWKLANLGQYDATEQSYLLSIARQRLLALLETAARAKRDPSVLLDIHMAGLAIGMTQSDYRLVEPWLDQTIEELERAGAEPAAQSLKEFKRRTLLARRVLENNR